VEIAAVVHAGERVSVGQLSGLEELLGIPDRGRARAGKRLELGDLSVLRHPVVPAPEDGKRADRPDVLLVERDGDTAADQAAGLVFGLGLVPAVVAVADADGPRPARGGARDRLARGLRGRHPQRGDERRVLGVADDGHGGVDAAGGGCGGQRLLEHRVQVDGRGDLREPARAVDVRPRVLERVPGRRGAVRVGHSRCGGGPDLATSAEDEHEEYERGREREHGRSDGEADRDPGSCVGERQHARSPAHDTRAPGAGQSLATAGFQLLACRKVRHGPRPTPTFCCV
jgi:hypothetical protein